MRAVKVLIVEDDQDFGEVLGMLITTELPGATFTHAATSAEAIQQARTEQPDVILIDHLVPPMPAGKLVGQLRENAPDAKLFLVSGLDAPTLARVSGELGIRAFPKTRLPDLIAQLRAL